MTKIEIRYRYNDGIGFFIWGGEKFLVVYADVLVVLNLFVTYFLLLCTKAMLRKHVKRKRLLLGALFGGFYALVIFLPPLPKAVSCLMNVIASLILIFLSFPIHSKKELLKTAAAFFSVNFAFAGIMFAIWLHFSPKGMVYENGSVYFDIDIKTLILSTTICYLILTLAEKLLKRRAPDNCLYEIELEHRGKTVQTTALLDTGNSLRDSFSDMTVIVAESTLCKELLGETPQNLFLNTSTAQGSVKEKMRLIPFSDVSKEGMLYAVIIDRLSVPQKRIEIQPVLLAESHQDFKNGEYRVILGNDFLERSKQYANHQKNKAVV